MSHSRIPYGEAVTAASPIEESGGRRRAAWRWVVPLVVAGALVAAGARLADLALNAVASDPEAADWCDRIVPEGLSAALGTPVVESNRSRSGAHTVCTYRVGAGVELAVAPDPARRVRSVEPAALWELLLNEPYPAGWQGEPLLPATVPAPQELAHFAEVTPDVYFVAVMWRGAPDSSGAHHHLGLRLAAPGLQGHTQVSALLETAVAEIIEQLREWYDRCWPATRALVQGCPHRDPRPEPGPT